jgi:hypothetical protein
VEDGGHYAANAVFRRRRVCRSRALRAMLHCEQAVGRESCGRTVTRDDYATGLIDFVEHNIAVRSAVLNLIAQGRVLPAAELRDQFCLIIGCRFA